nr:FAD-dependent oxidoreductase [Angustibacter aerolatus]
MPTRLLVVGADGAGMSAAHQALRTARRLGRELEVVAVDAGRHTSYSACGIPYWMAGDVASGDDLVARTADEHRAAGVDLRLETEAVEIDRDGQRVRVRSASGESWLGYDELVLATGAEPVLPDWARTPGVLPVHTLDDGAAWRRVLDERSPRRALVVGAGYVGVEGAESLRRRGLDVTLVTRGHEPMSTTMSADMAAMVREALQRMGVRVVTGTTVESLETAADGRVGAACLGDHEEPVDVVVVAIGVRPRVQAAVDAGIPLGDHGGLVTDDHQRLADGVWAAGDCCEVYDRVLQEHWYTPLGTHANKAGRVAGTNVGGGDAAFAGSVGTAITRAHDAEVARTGMLPSWARERGLDVESVTLQSTTASGYMPEADPMTVQVLGERGTGRLLGAQVVGGRGAGKRIDVVAMALWGGMTAADVAAADLAYAPPFSPTLDPVAVACRKARRAPVGPPRAPGQ